MVLGWESTSSVLVWARHPRSRAFSARWAPPLGPQNSGSLCFAAAGLNEFTAVNYQLWGLDSSHERDTLANKRLVTREWRDLALCPPIADAARHCALTSQASQETL